MKTTGSKFDGKSFCFTGAAKDNKGNQIKREELEEQVINNGGEVKGISKNLSYLVQQDSNSQTTKTRKALDYGVKIISVQEFYNMCYKL